MYRPTAFAEDRVEVLAAAIADITLATLVTPADGKIHVTHVPMFLRQDGDDLTLEAHVARANPHWRASGASVAIFQGPQAYISPSYYPSKAETEKVVPTWAYIAVHVHGVIEAVTDPDWMLTHLNRLTDHKERDREAAWQVSDAPESYIAARMRGIVGIRMEVARMEGSWKINQNKSDADQAGTETGLRGAGAEATALAEALAEIRRGG